MTEITCKCGAVYLETSHKLMMRDKDSAECSLCGETLKQWNGAEMYSYKLVIQQKAEERLIVHSTTELL